ncbi:MAG: P-loop ATPase, Sll1717 family [Terriglobales bacterium]
MTKAKILSAVNFGKRIAEDEIGALESYFVETDQWRSVFSGEIDIVYGAKGSGKSAIYSLLLRKTRELLSRQILVVPSENVMGAPVFQALVSDPPSSEEQIRWMWKLYFLSVLGNAIRSNKITNDAANELVGALEQARLLSPGWSLKRILRSVMDYVKRVEIGGEIKINPNTGLPEGVGGKITFREPTADQHNQGFVSADTLLEVANNAFAQVPLSVWMVLDRLDVAFSESAELEGKALRALFRVYLDMLGFGNIFLKIFLRDDIWERITETGFREASHITRYTRIAWDSQSLLNLIIRRALHNEILRQQYAVVPELILADTKLQQDLFYRVFPSQVEKTSTLNWMLLRTSDGKKQTAPRELIHLVSAARDQQLRLLEMGSPEPTEETLIDRTALKAALPEVSKVRFEQTLCAEYPALKPLLLRLEGEKTQQSPKTLAKIWATSENDAFANAEKLAEVGFFEKRGTKEEPSFWVPYIYRGVLRMIQGQAK